MLVKNFPKTRISIGVPIINRDVLSRAYHYADRLETMHRRKHTEVEQRCVTVIPPFLCSWEECAHIMNLCRLANFENNYITKVSYSVKGIYVMSFETELLFCLRVKKVTSGLETAEFLKTIKALKRDLAKLGVEYVPAPLEYRTPHIELFRRQKIKTNPLLIPRSVLNVVERSRKEDPVCFTSGKITLYQQDERGAWKPCPTLIEY